jgi:hypothetical protein
MAMTGGIAFSKTEEEVKGCRQAWMIVGFLLCDSSDDTGWISMDVGHIHIQYPVDNSWISSTSMDVLAQHPWISIDIHWMWWWFMRVIVVQESELDILMQSLYVL